MMGRRSRSSTYRTVTGCDVDLRALAPDECDFLAAVRQEFEGAPEWSVFADWWTTKLREVRLMKS
jgi:hypothetical protein